MAVTFTNAGNSYITYSASSVSLVQTRTWLTWLNFSSLTSGTIFWLGGSNLSQELISFFIGTGGEANKVVFFANWSGTDGRWSTAITTGLHMIAVSYDYGSTSNNPLIYIDGSLASTANTSPTGSYVSGTTGMNYIIGGSGSSSTNAEVKTVPTYNRILSAQEIADAYASKLAIPTTRGLIFAPQLWGCAGGVAEGGTMAAGNTVADAVTGALGVPSGSPVFNGDTVLTFQS